MIYVWHFIIVVSYYFIPIVFCNLRTAILVYVVFTSPVPGVIATLPTYTVLFIPFSCTVTVSGVTNIILNGTTVFDNNLVRGTSAIRGDSVICANGLSTKTCYPVLNCGLHCTRLSKLRFTALRQT